MLSLVSGMDTQHHSERGHHGHCDDERKKYSRWQEGTVPGGKRAQRLWPTRRAFQALVARGSTCSPLPLRAGPITNHLQYNE